MEAFITANEAMANFSDMLNRVARGEEIIITKNGTPAARIIPKGQANRKSLTEWMTGFLERRKSVQLNPPGMPRISLRELVEDGRG